MNIIVITLMALYGSNIILSSELLNSGINLKAPIITSINIHICGIIIIYVLCIGIGGIVNTVVYH